MPAIRADFTETVCVPPESHHWVASPGGEVERVMLDRVGDEVAVATSLVRYPPASRFPAHEHGLGEEFLVLDGEFGDEHGRYPPGTYVRNPPGTRHTPFSEPGCVIWVKLRQFHPDDRDQRVVLLHSEIPHRGSAAQTLFEFRDEVVTSFTAAAGERIRFPATAQVQEVLVVTGAVLWRGQRLEAWGWLRVPVGEGTELETAVPCQLLHKTRPGYAIPLTSATSAASAGT